MKQVSSSAADALGKTLYRVPVADSTEVGAVEVAPKATSQVVQAVVSSLIVCNTDTLAGTIDLVVFLEDLAGTNTYLLHEVSVGARETKVFNLGVTLSAGDCVVVASTRGYDWSLMGIETTKGTGPNV